MSGGLRHDSWPPGVKVRCLRRHFIAKKSGSWVESEIPEPENARSDPQSTLASICGESTLVLPVSEPSGDEPIRTKSIFTQTAAGVLCTHETTIDKTIKPVELVTAATTTGSVLSVPAKLSTTPISILPPISIDTPISITECNSEDSWSTVGTNTKVSSSSQTFIHGDLIGLAPRRCRFCNGEFKCGNPGANVCLDAKCQIRKQNGEVSYRRSSIWDFDD